MRILKSFLVVAGITTAAIALVGCGNKSTQEESDINRIKFCLSKIASDKYMSMTTPDTVNDYIETTPEYLDIIKIGEPALNYMLSEFEEGYADKNREFVMAYACSKIVGEEPRERTWTTGKEWYENYIRVFD
ncbi:MAG: hypothetical protein ACRC2K_10740 [Clostridium sp.]